MVRSGGIDGRGLYPGGAGLGGGESEPGGVGLGGLMAASGLGGLVAVSYRGALVASGLAASGGIGRDGLAGPPVRTGGTASVAGRVRTGGIASASGLVRIVGSILDGFGGGGMRFVSGSAPGSSSYTLGVRSSNRSNCRTKA